MKYIDVHAHIFPPAIAEKVVAQLEHYYGYAWEGSGLVEDLLGSMDRYGIDRTAVFSSATKPAQVEAINRYIAEVCAAHPDRLKDSDHGHYNNYGNSFPLHLTTLFDLLKGPVPPKAGQGLESLAGHQVKEFLDSIDHYVLCHRRCRIIYRFDRHSVVEIHYTCIFEFPC